jgi:HlyD family secretion protein
MRILLIVAGVAVAAAVAWLAVVNLSGGLPVEAAAVRRGDIREFVDDEGKTRLPESHLITMPYTGRLAEIELAEGAEVTQGQLVAQIVPADQELAVELAQAALDRAEAAIAENDDVSVEATGLRQTEKFVESMDHTVEAAAARVQSGKAKRDYAESNLARIRDLAARDERNVTPEQMDQAELRQVESDVDYQQDVLVHSALLAMKAATDLTPTAVQQYIERKDLTGEVLRKERAQAEFRLQEAERDAERGRMVSPVNGVVLVRHEYNERHLAAGTVLLEIGRLEDLEIEADLLSQDVVAVEEGDRVEVYGPAIGPEPVQATVARIYPKGFTKVSSLGVEQQRVKVIMRLEPDVLARLRTERRLGVDYRVNVRIITDERQGALVVPRSALFRGAGGHWQVFAVRSGRARLAEVTVGLLNDEWAEVTEGLAEGDTVVLAPETELGDGARVAPVLRQEE